MYSSTITARELVIFSELNSENSGITIIIVMPLFSLFSSLKMTNSRAVMVLLYTAVSVPYTIYFLLAFFKGISPTFEEAAAIDGCGPVKTFWLIMFPLARPAVKMCIRDRWNTGPAGAKPSPRPT